MSSVRARVMPLLAALTVSCALPGVAVAQTSAPQLPGLTEEPPPWRGGVSQEPQPSGQDDPSDGQAAPSGSADGTGGPTAGELPRTGSEPLLLGLSGAALALVGTGLRLRTLDADLY